MANTSIDKPKHTPRLFCVLRNYVAHAKEMQTQVPSEPVLFMKPACALVLPNDPLHYPKHGNRLEHECEFVMRVGQSGPSDTAEQALKLIDGITVGIDLTLRDVQAKLKENRYPWELAKAFPGSAPIGDFIAPPSSLDDLSLIMKLKVNDEVRQSVNIHEMIFSPSKLIQTINDIWPLQAGDLIFTGTPEGVGEININDTVTISAPNIGEFSWILSA